MGHVQALYVFVPTNLPAMESREGRLILALYKGIKEDGLKGRYVVYQDPEKWVESCWISDYDFNEILASFGSGLPLPSEFDVSPRAQLRRIAPVGIMLFVVVFGLIGFRMILRRRSGNQSKNQPSVP
jgi:hypothetical protein